MRKGNKFLLIVLTAALVLAAIAGTANARRLTTTSQTFRIVWPTEAKLTFGGSLLLVSCAVTLEGTFHSRTISKVSGQLIGFVTRAQLARPCVGSGEAWILNGIERIGGVTTPNTLPWHVRYDSFKGTLPRITGVRIQLIGFGLLIELVGESCLYASTTVAPAFVIAERNATTGEIAGIRYDESVEIPKSSGGAVCPPTGVLGGSATSTVLGATTRIVLRLVA